jgi:hypothetical protein
VAMSTEALELSSFNFMAEGLLAGNMVKADDATNTAIAIAPKHKASLLYFLDNLAIPSSRSYFHLLFYKLYYSM